jgi:probable HAF family extracellular repeat protein
MRLKTDLIVALAFSCVLGPAHSNTVGFIYSGGTYATIAFPGATDTFARGINDLGQVVGFYSDKTGGGGFLYSGGVYTQISFPSIPVASSLPLGINNAGQIVGFYDYPTGEHGYLYSGGTFTTLSIPSPNIAERINNLGQILDSAILPGSLISSSLIYSGSGYAALPFNGASDINDVGQIVGGHGDKNGFLYTGGIITTFAVPGALLTFPTGINDLGQIVGYYIDAMGEQHGFLLDSDGTFTTIDAISPSLLSGTQVFDINDSGQIVGSFSVAVPEPSTWAMN